MGAGLARGAQRAGFKIAFGDGQRIIWAKTAQPIYIGNPNVAWPGEESATNLKWVPHYSGHRLYTRFDKAKSRWIWNYEFKAQPGEVFFSPKELSVAHRFPGEYILIDPNVVMWKDPAVNRRWKKFQQVADELGRQGLEVVQFEYPDMHVRLKGVKLYSAPTFRSGMLCLSRAKLFIGHEGGMHHAAAALGIPAVVIFGGYVPPAVTGYDTHVNLTGGETEACGSTHYCEHCQQALARITPDEVVHHALLGVGREGSRRSLVT